METLERELKLVIARRLDAAGSREVLAIASALCGGDAAPSPAAPTSSASPRFRVDGDTVLDQATGLMWSRDNVPGGRMNWKDAQDACSKLALAGRSDWRLPTIRELLTLVDYGRHNPAIDTDSFKSEASYYWSSTPVHSSPGVSAWVVGFGYGNADWSLQVCECFVRAVRASQSLDLWHVK